MTELALRIVCAFVAGVVLTPIVRLLALRWGVVAHPKADRWHERPTPLLGGLSIAIVVLAGGLTIEPLRDVGFLLVCATFIAGMGLVDDLISLKSSTKLVFEILVASAFVYAGHRLNWTHSLTLDALLTLVWIVGITNALNLLDNMDGLAAGIGVIACVSLLLARMAHVPVSPDAQLLATLLGALAAFLVFNTYPASIFMGDTGSLLTGLALAVVSVMSASEGGSRELLSVVAGPVLVLFIPIFDTTFVVFARMIAGRRPSQGGRDHSSHRLVKMGLSEPRAVAVLWGLAAIGGVIAVSLQKLDDGWVGVAAVVFGVGMALFAAYLAAVRVYEDSTDWSGTPLVVQFMYKRRVLEVLLDLTLVCIAFYSAHRLRFDYAQFTAVFPYFLGSMPVVIGCQIVVLFALGAYRGMWRYFGLMDAVVFGKSVVIGTLTSAAAVALLQGGLRVPGAVFVIYAALLMLLLTASRASFRLISEFINRRVSGRRVVIYATGRDEQMVVQRLTALGERPRRLVGFFSNFIEDGSRILVQGYPMLGDYDDLLQFIAAGLTDDVIASVQEIEGERLEELAQHCDVHGVKLVQFRYSLETMTSSIEK